MCVFCACMYILLERARASEDLVIIIQLCHSITFGSNPHIKVNFTLLS